MLILFYHHFISDIPLCAMVIEKLNMIAQVLFLAVILCTLYDTAHSNLLDFRQVIKCITGQNPFKFYHYGCHCGFSGGQDYQPVDAIDACCKEHALCYKSCSRQCSNLYFLQSYTLVCDANQGTAYNTDPSPCSTCAFNCDLTASLCFKENFATFDKAAAICHSNPVRGLMQSFNGQPVTNTLETWGDKFLNGAQSFFSFFGKK